MVANKTKFDEPTPKFTHKKPHFHGHRERLRNKFIKRGADALEEYELLEMLLFKIFAQKDTKPIAKNLIAEFGSLAQVLAAPKERLLKVKGIGEVAAIELKLVNAAGLYLAQGNIVNRPLLTSWKQVIEYCHTAIAFEEKEVFRLLFLDKKNY